MTTRMPPARFALVAAFILLALTLVPVALADKGGGGHSGGGSTSSGGGHHGGGKGGGGTTSSSSITGPVMVVDNNGNGLPNYGDTVMFNVSTTATTEPYVDLQCFQNGVLVAEGWRGYWSGALDTPYFGLYSGTWSGGAADCTAYLDMSTSKGMQQLASVSFHVDA